MILTYKKENRPNLKNYKPISLRSQIYQLFRKILTNKLTNKLDEYQPVEQAAFRKDYSTCDHLLGMKLLTRKITENLGICLAFVDVYKAFGSIEHWVIINSLKYARIDHRYTQLIKYIYEKAISKI